MCHVFPIDDGYSQVFYLGVLYWLRFFLSKSFNVTLKVLLTSRLLNELYIPSVYCPEISFPVLLTDDN